MTSLANAVGATTTTWLVDNDDIIAGLNYPIRLVCEDEAIEVTGAEYVTFTATERTSWTVRRGVDGTTPAAHAGLTAITASTFGGAGGSVAAGDVTVDPTVLAAADAQAALVALGAVAPTADEKAAFVGVGNAPPSAANAFLTYADYTLALLLGESNDAGGEPITNLADPGGDQDAATKKWVVDNPPGLQAVITTSPIAEGTLARNVLNSGHVELGADGAWRFEYGAGTLIMGADGLLDVQISGFGSVFSVNAAGDIVLNGSGVVKLGSLPSADPGAGGVWINAANADALTIGDGA